MSSWKKRRIHKRKINHYRAPLPKGATLIACMIRAIDAHYATWAWAKVTCLACLKKRPRA